MILIDCIKVTPTFFFNTYGTGLYELYQYSLHSTLGDSNLTGHLPLCWLWFVCQADKYMCIVAEKIPANIFFATITHNFYCAINVATCFTLHDNDVVLYAIVLAQMVLGQPEDSLVQQSGQILFLHRANTAGTYEHV